MPKRRYSLFFVMLFFVAFQAAAQARAAGDGELRVRVKKSAGMVIVDVSMAVGASAQETWAVLTDYDNMARFFPNLVSSKVTQRSGNRLRLEQKGKISYGPLSFPFESIREIELSPCREIRSRAVAGSLKKGDATTRLLTENGTTRLLYHSESLPNAWVPPAIGPKLMESGIRTQFESLRNEILKRKRAGKNAQPSVALT